MRTRPLGYEWPGAYFIGQEELDLVDEVVRARSPFRYYGLDCRHMCDQFEREFAAYVGAPHALAVSSGTAALNVAMAALGIGPGQEVLVPGYMWISTVAAVVQRGAIPVLCEIDDSFALDPAEIRAKGYASDDGGRRRSHERHGQQRPSGLRRGAAAEAPGCGGLREACGASSHGQRLGTFGDMGIFSFQYNKAMTTGEGGMVVAADSLLMRRAEAAQDIGHSRNLAGRLAVDPNVLLWGLGARMSELQAAFGLAQLRKLDRIANAMRQAKYRLRESLAGLPGVKLRRIDDPSGDNGAFLVTTYPTRDAARAMVERLRRLGIDNGPDGLLLCHFEDWGFHLYYNMPALVKKASTSGDGFPWTHPLNLHSVYDYDQGALPRTDDLFARSVIQAVPSNCTAADADDIIEAYRAAAAEVLPGRGDGP